MGKKKIPIFSSQVSSRPDDLSSRHPRLLVQLPEVQKDDWPFCFTLSSTFPALCKWHGKRQCMAPGWWKPLGCFFDVLDVCPNTKLLGSKVQKAVVTLLQEKAVVFDHKMKEQDGVDRIDLYLRNLLYQMRVLRLSSEIRGRVFRMLSTAEQTQLEMCLDKVKLPPAILAQGLGGGSFGDSVV